MIGPDGPGPGPVSSLPGHFSSLSLSPHVFSCPVFPTLSSPIPSTVSSVHSILLHFSHPWCTCCSLLILITLVLSVLTSPSSSLPSFIFNTLMSLPVSHCSSPHVIWPHSSSPPVMGCPGLPFLLLFFVCWLLPELLPARFLLDWIYLTNLSGFYWSELFYITF